MFIDSHAHIELIEYDHDRDEVIMRAREAGVDVIITIGVDLDDCRKAIAMAARYEAVYAAVGVHPHDVKTIDGETYSLLKEMAGKDKVVAYGEIGLDFYRNHSPREVQIRRFAEQLDLAREVDLPVIIHNREAHTETLRILSGWKGRQRGVIHCFSGDYDVAKKFLDLGFYISIPGTVTFEKSIKLQEVVRQVPLTSLLIETDAPFLAPHPYRGKRNEPAFVVHTARKVAELKGLSVEEVGDATSQNARILFKLGTLPYFFRRNREVSLIY